ncbi:MAG: hypothetical protein V3R82_06985 [Candidatus Hydrothermarchaeales archaeon]
MTITEYTYPLDNEFNNYIKAILAYDKGLEDIVVIYYTIDEGREVPLVTYDLAHGFPHRDIRFLDKKDKRKKKEFRASPEELHSIAIDDINSNWKRYLKEYLSTKKE